MTPDPWVCVRCNATIPADPDFAPDGKYAEEPRAYCSPRCASGEVNRIQNRPDERVPGWWSR